MKNVIEKSRIRFDIFWIDISLIKGIALCDTAMFWESEGGREYGGEICLGVTMKGYQPGGSSYLGP